MTKISLAILACAVAAIQAGCNNAPVTTTEAADFNKAVTDVAARLKASLSEIQAVEVANRVDAFARSSQRRLDRVDVEPKLSDGEVGMITNEFDFLVAYSKAMKDATTPGSSWGKSVSGVNSAETRLMGDTQALDNRATGRTVITDHNVKTFNSDATGVAKAFSSVGEGLLVLYGEEKAAKIAAAVDPDVQKYCSDLENLITSDPDSKTPGDGLAGILHADYEERIASVKLLATTAAPPTGFNDSNYFSLVQERTTVLTEYTSLLQCEKTGLANLLALRKAIAEIASAHKALANRDDLTFKERLSDAEDLAHSVSAANPTEKDDSSN